MNVTLFSQIISNLNRVSFNRIVERYGSDKHSKGINSWTHLVSMLFCHFAKANSLREISNGLRSATGNLNHLGVTLAPSKSSLSYINHHRDWHIFKDYYFELLEQFSKTVRFKRIKFNQIQKKIFLLDATVISLCLSVFDWARYRQKKGAVKLHVLLDYDGCLPSYVNLTDGKVADVRAAKSIPIPKDSVVVADRAYVDFRMWNAWDNDRISFVIRMKSSVKYIVKVERELPPHTDQHILNDETIILENPKSYDHYPKRLRRVAVWDDVNKKTIELITNQMSWTAATIAELYKQRWQIETFFKALKQLMKIKTFVGTSENAVLIQIWTALISMLILKYLRQLAEYAWSLSNLLAFLRMNLFVKINLTEWLNHPFRDNSAADNPR
ncbi:MAG: IS4 family transposase [Candidatus Marinimicrobia bacterium]|nr:IS4 family transposase [Candidatus Neomarinimicrobiota bacterium]MCF7904578.1 IS4 family transposase [Candidatus Neomarinimicrobiota bacterium]